MPNAEFNGIWELVMTAFLLIGGSGKSSRPGGQNTRSGRAMRMRLIVDSRKWRAAAKLHPCIRLVPRS
jgi:hypothetical protein